MNEIIKVNYENERPTVSGRELHEFLEVGTKYTDWFSRMCEYGFSECIDYALVAQKRETNNPKNPYTEFIDHQLTIEMSKEIAMIQRNEKGKQARQYFIALEKQWNSPQLCGTFLSTWTRTGSSVSMRYASLLVEARAGSRRIKSLYQLQYTRAAVNG